MVGIVVYNNANPSKHIGIGFKESGDIMAIMDGRCMESDCNN